MTLETELLLGATTNHYYSIVYSVLDLFTSVKYPFRNRGLWRFTKTSITQSEKPKKT
jgi:bacteriorhodopsin